MKNTGKVNKPKGGMSIGDYVDLEQSRSGGGQSSGTQSPTPDQSVNREPADVGSKNQ